MRKAIVYLYWGEGSMKEKNIEHPTSNIEFLNEKVELFWCVFHSTLDVRLLIPQYDFEQQISPKSVCHLFAQTL